MVSPIVDNVRTTPSRMGEWIFARACDQLQALSINWIAGCNVHLRAIKGSTPVQ